MVGQSLTQEGDIRKGLTTDYRPKHTKQQKHHNHSSDQLLGIKIVLSGKEILQWFGQHIPYIPSCHIP